ncbi:MAG: EAL domain-containing protein [Bacilli bacterium]|nr:EAL domain-containing protein [Bacilli bacterium]
MAERFPRSFSARRKILIVDDELINCEILSAILENDYDISLAHNGKDALELLTSTDSEFSLIMLDLMMPVMDGDAFLEQKKLIPSLRDIPVIVLTSETKKEVESLRHGATDFIKKPYESPEIIQARVERIIENYESSRTIRDTSADLATGLYTKEYFDHFAKEILKNHPQGDFDMVVIYLTNFTIAEELAGPIAMSKALHEVGEYLRNEARKYGGIATRSSQEAFLFLAEHRESYDEFFHGLVDMLTAEFGASRLRMKLGIYSHIDMNSKLPEMCARAFDAFEAIRNDSVAKVNYYDAKLHEANVLHERLLQCFENSLQNQEFKVFFQPKYSIEGDEPRLAGAEALVRWAHPEFGMISPGVFIPLFEKYGYIRSLDRFVYQKTAEMISRLKKELGVELPISCNVSRVDIFDPNLCDVICSLVQKYGFEPKLLHLEVTETVYSENTMELIAKTAHLREMGFEIEMDDFGSGYSSLNMLSSLPFDVLKIDTGFVRNLFQSDKNLLILHSIVDLANLLEVRTVAEGVENKEQLDKLKEFGCDLIQGYYFSKPLPEEDFFARVKGELVS